MKNLSLEFGIFWIHQLLGGLFYSYKLLGNYFFGSSSSGDFFSVREILLEFMILGSTDSLGILEILCPPIARNVSSFDR